MFDVDEAQWNTPENWNQEIDVVYVNDRSDRLGGYILSDAILDLSLGGTKASSWIFVDNRSERSFKQQNFYFAYLNDTDSRNVSVFVYRGHHLYGL